MTKTARLVRVAYFSMEIGLEPSVPTYSGGLGVLAGDTIRSAADLAVPMVALTLCYRHGYFTQRLDAEGAQREEPTIWAPESRLAAAGPTVAVEIEGRRVLVRAWVYEVRGASGAVVPVYLLDTDIEGNAEYDRTLTNSLYGGDRRYRLAQEAILGLGGAALLAALEHDGVIEVGPAGIQHHLNEGHAALVALALAERQMTEGGDIGERAIAEVRRQCVFTTHTPVPAGHDTFDRGLVEQVLGAARVARLERLGGMGRGMLHMTDLALHTSHYVNAVARRHQTVSRQMFPGHDIVGVTNGVHAGTWTAPAFARLFDEWLPGWRTDNFRLRHAVDIPLDAIRGAHREAKAALIAAVRERTGVELDAKVLTIGFARRATGYKRADLVFTDPARLAQITRAVGPLQLVFAGKAHPHDESGKQLIRRIHAAAREVGGSVRVVYLENYDMELGALVTSGTDIWLNTPMRPLEASGTSGMKAALNGVPSLSILDGWWVEGCIEGATGWAIGREDEQTADPARDAEELYQKLERTVAPLFYAMPYEFARIQRQAIAANGSYFNTQRMVLEYARQAYGMGVGG